MSGHTAVSDGSGYFLYHSIGVYPEKAADMAKALSAFSGHWGAGNDDQWTHAFAARQQFVDAWSSLIAAPPGTLTTTENVTTALHALISALPGRHLEGKRVLIAADCFPSLHFLLTGLAGRYGFTLDTVPLRQGENWVHEDDFITHWTPDVGLALLTWVTSTNSHRSDLDRLVAHGRDMGSLIGVDITQAVGLLPFRVDRTADRFCHFDVFEMAMRHAGRRYFASRARAAAGMRTGIARLVQPGRYFLLGPGWLWLCSRYPSLRQWHSVDHGLCRIRAGAQLARCAGHDRNAGAQPPPVGKTRRWRPATLGMMLVSPENEAERGGSVMAKAPGNADPNTVLDHLRSCNIYADHRGPVLRFSPGFVTTDEAVDALLEGLSEALTLQT